MAGSSKQRHRVLQSVVRAAMPVLVTLMRFVPLYAFYVAGWVLGAAAYILSRRYRRLAAYNLDLAYGDELEQQEKRRVARGCFVTLIQEWLLLLKFVNLKPRQIQTIVRIQHEDRLKNALSYGRGIVLVTGHLSNFPLAVTRLSRAGYAVGCFAGGRAWITYSTI